VFTEMSEFFTWWEQRRRDNAYHVARTPLDQLDGWMFEPGTGNLVHRSGKFFSVQGLEVRTDHRQPPVWRQPILVQPEIGILGIVVTVRDGQPYCLMQAKMEPGNINLLQLSPTVQATRSNYTRVHRGNPVPYLEQFVEGRRGRVVFDALQSEQGSWFMHKRNRNMIVQVTDALPVREDFCWLSLDLLGQLLSVDNLVNMDARTVLSGMPFAFGPDPYGRPGATRDPYGSEPALHSVEQLLSWFTEAKARYFLERRLVPLREAGQWRRDADRIYHPSGRHFEVIGVDVQASNREVAQWSQPMLAPCDRGVIGFVGRTINGVFHLLVQARTEAGTQDIVEMAPTVTCIPANYDGCPPSERPPYLDLILDAPPERRIVDVVHSEEGGRFYHAENRYVVVDVGEDFDLEQPPDFIWMTVGQLTGFVRYGNYVNVAARCLLTCMASKATQLAAIGG